MVQRIGGPRRKSRALMTKDPRRKGKVSITQFFKQLKEGDRVKIITEPAVHAGILHRRFYGKQGVVKGKTGRCYHILIHDGHKEKTVITHPVHLRKV